MQRKFLSNLGLIVFLNLLVKPFYILGIDAEVQNVVGKESYGLYFGLLNLSFLFNILIDLGINNFNNRNIAQNVQLVSKHFSKLFTLKAALALIYAAITLILGWVLNYQEKAFHILLILTLNQVIVSFIQFARSNLTALHLFSRDSIISILDRGLLIVFCGILLFTNITDGVFKIEWFVYLQTIAYTITLFSSLIMLAGRTGRLKWNWDRLFFLQILRKSIPYGVFILTGMLYGRIDGIMLDKLGPEGSETAGEYAQGYRFYEAACMFAYLFAVLLLPIFSRLLKENKAEIISLVNTSTRILVGGTLATAIIFLFHSDTVLNWRYADVSLNSVYAFSALMIAFIGTGLFYVFGTLLTANENLKSLNIISFIGLSLNVILNLLLIPKYGAFGAAITTMFTQLTTGLAQLVLAGKTFRFGINWKLLFQFAAYAVLAFSFNFFVVDELSVKPMQALLISVIVGIGVLFISGLFSVYKIRLLIKSWK